MRSYFIPLLLAAFLCPGALAEPPNKTFTIGVSTALTGEASGNGLDIRDSVLFANEKLAGNKYKLIFEDDKCSPKEAVSIAQKFVNIEKVDAVIGFACSGAALAAAPIYERAEVPVIATCASAPGVPASGKYIFRTTMSDLFGASILFDYVKDYHKVFAILSEETDYAQRLAQAFEKSNEKGLLRLERENYPPGTTDFRTILLRLRAKRPEGLFINSQSEDTFAVILMQLKALGWNVPLYGAYWPASPFVLKIAGKQAEGIIFIDTPSLDQILTPEGKGVYEEFRKQYGELRSIEAMFATTFEAFRALHQALEKGGDAREYLQNTEFSGLFGPYRFVEDGEIEGISFALKKIEGGKAVLLE